jgi:plasmid stabilization system protein ParE
MTVVMRGAAEEDLRKAFEYYEAAREGLGDEFLNAFREGVDRVLQFPSGWHALDETYRRCTLRRFPYGIIYRRDERSDEIVVVAIMHLHRKPDVWRQSE